MSEIDRFLAMTNQEAALSAIAGEEDSWDTEARGSVEKELRAMGRLDACDEAALRRIDLSRFHNDGLYACQMFGSLVWYDNITFGDVAWCAARCLSWLKSSYREPREFGMLQDALLTSIEDWVFKKPAEMAGYSNLIAACLVEISVSLLGYHGVGSRSIVGTIILCTKSGHQLSRLVVPGRKVKYGHSDIVCACDEIERIDSANTIVQPLSHGIELLGLYGDVGFAGWAFERLSPVIALCHPIGYQKYLSGLTEWYGSEPPGWPYPFTQVMIRDSYDVLNRLDQSACERIRRELRG